MGQFKDSITVNSAVKEAIKYNKSGFKVSEDRKKLTYKNAKFTIEGDEVTVDLPSGTFKLNFLNSMRIKKLALRSDF